MLIRPMKHKGLPVSEQPLRTVDAATETCRSISGLSNCIGAGYRKIWADLPNLGPVDIEDFQIT